ncbi:hypothetical protein ACL2DZ_08525 (plasmid) [Sinorhizobium meliloti]
MAEQDTLRFPRVDLSDGGFGPLPLEEERQSHPEEFPAVRMVHAGEPRDSSPRLSDLVQLDVDDGIGKDQRLGRLVKENEFLEVGRRGKASGRRLGSVPVGMSRVAFLNGW